MVCHSHYSSLSGCGKYMYFPFWILYYSVLIDKYSIFSGLSFAGGVHLRWERRLSTRLIALVLNKLSNEFSGFFLHYFALRQLLLPRQPPSCLPG
jgi:hypothetical protein